MVLARVAPADATELREWSEPERPEPLPAVPADPPPAEPVDEPAPDEPLDLAEPATPVERLEPLAPEPAHLVARLPRRLAPPAAPAPEPAPAAAEPAPVPPSTPEPQATPVVDLGELMTEEAPRPVYPRRAWEQGIGGTVVLLALVKADGTVEACEVESSSGHELLDEAARAALKRWRFRPRIVGGRARPFTVRVPFDFLPPRR